jgi:hypothetical protein
LNEDKKVISKMRELESSSDLVKQMKDYWDKQNDKIILKALKREFKSKINDKAKELKQLEYKWRETKTELIEKEELIRKKEKELKVMIKEFLTIYKEDKARNERKGNNKKPLKKKKPRKK